MKCNTVLGVIDVAKFIDVEEKFISFNLFDAFFAWKNRYESASIKLKDIYSWSETLDKNFINVRKGKGPPQRILREIKLTPEFYFNTALYDAEGGKKSNTLVSNSDERIVMNIFHWYLSFQPTLEGIREIRIFMHVDEAEKLFNLNKIEELIKTGKITSKDSRNINQSYSVLRKCGVVKDTSKLNALIQKYLGVSPTLSGLIDKLRIKWDPLHKKTVFEIYYSNTLNPLIASLTEALLFKLPEYVEKGVEIDWIKWILPPSKFMCMGFINLTMTENRKHLLTPYKQVQESGNDSIIISRGREGIRIKSRLKISPMLLFGLAHCMTEKFSTSTPWELAGYVDFISAFGKPEDLITNVSIVFLAEEYTVLMKRLTTLFDEKGNFRSLDVRHKELEQQLANYLWLITGKKVPVSKITVHKIPYKEGIAVLMFHFPELFQDLYKLANQSPDLKQVIEEVVKEKGLGRHAGKASFHMEFRGTLHPLLNTLAEKALTHFCQFFNAYVKNHKS